MFGHRVRAEGSGVVQGSVHLRALAIPLLALSPLLGCADECADDGLGQEKCPEQETEGASDSSAASDGATAGASESGTASASGTAGSGSASASGTGSGSASDSGSDSGSGGGPGCANGVQDGDESDVDCGGSCEPCPDGKVCNEPDDCLSMMCVEQVCGDPVCADELMDNTCQACLKASCCESLVSCFQDTYCTCWFGCIQHNNDFEPCKTQCMGNNSPGEVTSCANSQCNYDGACGA